MLIGCALHEGNPDDAGADDGDCDLVLDNELLGVSDDLH